MTPKPTRVSNPSPFIATGLQKSGPVPVKERRPPQLYTQADVVAVDAQAGAMIRRALHHNPTPSPRGEAVRSDVPAHNRYTN